MASDQSLVQTAAGPSPELRGSTTRSCNSCHSKKIRCDKNEPCSACVRAGKPCSFPRGPRVRRTKKTIMSDMAARISLLEQSLVQARKETAELATPKSQSSGSSSPPLSRPEVAIRDDVLLQEGSSSQYFNEVLFSKVLEEVRDGNADCVLTAQPNSDHTEPSPFNALGIVSTPSSSFTPASLHPPKQLAVKLWNIFQISVENCTGSKLLHAPTDQLRVFSTIDDPAAASYENLALSFVIYYLSLISLDRVEVQTSLGHDRTALLLRFKVGLEQALAHGNFLDRPTITTLHVLVLYLTALRVNNSEKGIWILRGLPIRMAHSLGLHKDGERLGLSPFQAELRRRVYWDIVSHDHRAGEDYGYEENSNKLLSSVSSVKLPLNVEDVDLYPEMKSLPPERKEWTKMSFPLIHIRLAQTMQRLVLIAQASSPSSPPDESQRAKAIAETRDFIEKRLAYYNPIIPQQRLTLSCSRFLLRKLDFVSRMQWILLKGTNASSEFATEANLIEALELLESRLVELAEDELLRPFQWINRAYPQFHVSMYILWYLCVKPKGPNVDRAWRGVDAFFADEARNERSQRSGSKSAVLAAIRAKALSIKQNLPDMSPSRLEARSVGPSAPLTEHGSQNLYTANDLDLRFYNADEWPEWPTLLQGFQLDSPDAFWQ